MDRHADDAKRPSEDLPERQCFKQSFCYLSTPGHMRTFVGRFIYLYTGKGRLSLTGASLEFLAENGSLLAIPLNAIAEVSVGQHSLWAKPTGLDYIAIHHRNVDGEQTTLLTPSWSRFEPTWETNKCISEWVNASQAVMPRSA
jgi:hypothetical protein